MLLRRLPDWQRVWLKALGAIAVAACLVAAGSAPASAATLEINYTSGDAPFFYSCEAYVETSFAHGCFNSGGDHFYVEDTKVDYMRVAVHWKLKDGSRQGLCIQKNGQDSSDVDCDKNFIEGKAIIIRVGRCDGDVHSCTELSQYEDWSAYDGATT